VPRGCGEDFARPFKATSNQRRANFLAVHTEAKFRASEEAERDTDNGKPAVVVVEAGLSELDFMGSIDVDHVFEMDNMIFGFYVNQNVAPLNTTTERFDNVASFTDENSGVIPAREYFVSTPVTDFLTKANQAAGPAGTLSEDEIAGRRVGDLFAGPEGSDRPSVKRRRRAFCEHE
jgi:hypothetical protein